MLAGRATARGARGLLGAAACGATRPALRAQDVREKGSKAHFVSQVAAVARAVADSAAAAGGGAQPALPPGCVEYILAGTFHVRRRARPRLPGSLACARLLGLRTSRPRRSQRPLRVLRQAALDAQPAVQLAATEGDARARAHLQTSLQHSPQSFLNPPKSSARMPARLPPRR